MRSYIVCLLSSLIPSTRLFEAKRFLFMLAGAQLGRSVSICSPINLFLRGDLIVGDNVWIGRSTDFVIPVDSRVVIGKSCDIGPYVKFMCGTHLIGSSTRRAGPCIAKDIVIGNGCWIGTCVTILGGATVGNGSVIAAGSLLLPKQYPSNVLLAGTPARIVRHLDD